MSFLALPVLFLLPGYLLARALWLDSTNLSFGERVFIPVAFSISISVWLGLVLAEFGIFSLALLTALIIIFSALVFGARRKKFAAWDLKIPHPDRGGWVFLATLVIAILLVAHPAENIIGANDAGTYVNTGYNLARTGALAIYDPLVVNLGADPSKQFFSALINPYMLYTQVRLPGFFVHDAANGIVLPQFLHLYPVYLAIFFSALGLSGGLYATPLIGLLGSVAAYFLAKILFGRRVALLAFFLLVINVPQFWFARYPVSESFTQFLLLTAIYAFTRVITNKSTAVRTNPVNVPPLGFALLSALAFGEIFLIRLDALLLLAPLGIYLLVLLWTRAWRREHFVFFGVFGVLLVHAFAHVWNFAPNYIYFELTHVLRTRNIIYNVPTAEEFLKQPTYLAALVASGVLGVMILFALDRLFARLHPPLPRFSARNISLARWLGIAFTVAAFAYVYFIAPRVTTLYAYVGGETPFDSQANFVKLGWYLSPFGMGLAVLGLALFIRRALNRQNVFFLGTTLLFIYFFGEELYSNPHYIYTMRHYIPLVVPALIIFAAYATVQMTLIPYASLRFARTVRFAGGGLLLLWLAYNTYAMGIVDGTRKDGFAVRLPFLATTTFLGPVRVESFDHSIAGFSELAGAVTQIDSLAQMIPANAVAIFSNNRDEPSLVATPLEYIFGRDALVSVFNNPNGDKVAAKIDEWGAQGREVILFYGMNGGKLTLPARYDLERIGDFSFDVQQWAFAYQYMPRAPWRLNLNYTAYRVVPARNTPTYPLVVDFGSEDQRYTAGGFLERDPGTQTRWSGIIVDAYNDPNHIPQSVTASLRFPLSVGATNLKLTLTLRAPRDGTQMIVRSGEHEIGRVTLTTELRSYSFDLPRDLLEHDAETFFISVEADAFKDAEGKYLGVEFQKAKLE